MLVAFAHKQGRRGTYARTGWVSHDHTYAHLCVGSNKHMVCMAVTPGRDACLCLLQVEGLEPGSSFVMPVGG